MADRRYQRRHQNARAEWQAIIDRQGATCARCRRAIVPGMKWDLDHADDRVSYLGPSHARCNRVAGAKLGAAITNAKRRARRRVSRRW